jgi:hypothetical protein
VRDAAASGRIDTGRYKSYCAILGELVEVHAAAAAAPNRRGDGQAATRRSRRVDEERTR